MKKTLTLSRRQFLRRTTGVAGALALPTVVPARVLGADAPSNKLNIALIGACGVKSKN